jgi:hypothetical protein
MKREEISYSIKPLQFANGITRREVKQTMCAQKKKEWIKETIRQIEKNCKKNESRRFFSDIK